jgi:hypothetical protein
MYKECDGLSVPRPKSVMEDFWHRAIPYIREVLVLQGLSVTTEKVHSQDYQVLPGVV